MQQGRIWHLGKIEFSVDLKLRVKTLIEDLVQVWNQSKSIFMKEIRHLKTKQNKTKEKAKRNLNTNQHLLQNDQHADRTLLHSHDELPSSLKRSIYIFYC